ncbi:MAG: hypothetical protein BGO39_07800 [Chloroflexi bacterium 54-19]|nr:MAG: hypothetical protein BGO39_07800 [Chloroflexi bacterium 54-19]
MNSSMQLDPELLLAKYKQNDMEREAQRSRQAREAKTNQSSWFTRPGSLNRHKTPKSAANWDSK